MAAATFGGLDPQATADFTEKLYLLAMAYMGGQSLADLGKYAGEAFSAAKKIKPIEGKELAGEWTAVAAKYGSTVLADKGDPAPEAK